jgi:hypothetical protein
MTAEGVRTALFRNIAGADPKLCQQLATQFGDDMLLQDAVPDDYFQLFLDILQTRELYEMPGVSDLFTTLYIEREKITDQQNPRLIDAIVANYHCFSDDNLCLVICDMVARIWPPAIALGALEEMAKTRHATAVNAVCVGLEVILRHLERNSELYLRASVKYRQLMS